jgi:hypothetical protein
MDGLIDRLSGRLVKETQEKDNSRSIIPRRYQPAFQYRSCSQGEEEEAELSAARRQHEAIDVVPARIQSHNKKIKSRKKPVVT